MEVGVLGERSGRVICFGALENPREECVVQCHYNGRLHSDDHSGNKFVER